MTQLSAADRLADGFPHGTPAGYKDGCRSNGGCPNRNTERMTCKEASTRYARDSAYRRAYSTGDIWLDRPEERDPEAERVRTSLARRTQHQRGIASDPTRAVVDEGLAPAPKFAGLESGIKEMAPKVRAAVEQIKAEAPYAAALPPRSEASSYQRAQARITQLEQQLAHVTAGEQRAVGLARMATQEAETAKGERDAALAEAERLRGEMTSTLAAARRYTPGNRASVEVYTMGDQLHVSLNALLDPQSVATLTARLTEQRSS